MLRNKEITLVHGGKMTYHHNNKKHHCAFSVNENNKLITLLNENKTITEVIFQDVNFYTNFWQKKYGKKYCGPHSERPDNYTHLVAAMNRNKYLQSIIFLNCTFNKGVNPNLGFEKSVEYKNKKGQSIEPRMIQFNASTDTQLSAQFKNKFANKTVGCERKKQKKPCNLFDNWAFTSISVPPYDPLNRKPVENKAQPILTEFSLFSNNELTSKIDTEKTFKNTP